jgi:4-amino-4-deoxy-L-arabinose transferase-like glycosyltransferase
LALLAILILAAFLRTWRLGLWPMFADEDAHSATTREIVNASFLSGFKIAATEADKPVPLFWIRAMLWPLFGSPWMAGRWLSAAAGVATTGLCFVLGRRVWGNAAGVVAALVYATSPWALIEDRQNVQDPVMTALILVILLMILDQSQRPTSLRPYVVAALGFVAVFVKASAFLLVPVPWLAYMLWVKRPWRPEERRSMTVMTMGPAIAFSAVKFFNLGGSTDRFHPIHHIPTNFLVFCDAVHTYMGMGMVILCILGAVLLYRRDYRMGAFLVCLTLGWSADWMATSDFAPSRYYLIAVALAAVAAGSGAVGLVEWSWRHFKAAGMVAGAAIALIVAMPARTSVRLIQNFATAPMAKLDDWQYRSGWPSGYAFPEAEEWLRSNVPPGANVGYVIDVMHKEDAGLFAPLPAGIVSLGYIQEEYGKLKLPKMSGTVYLMVDDGRWDSRYFVRRIMRRIPSASEVKRFLKPGSNLGVSIMLINNAGDPTPGESPSPVDPQTRP